MSLKLNEQELEILKDAVSYYEDANNEMSDLEVYCDEIHAVKKLIEKEFRKVKNAT